MDPLVILPGFLSDARGFLPQIVHLGADRQVTVILPQGETVEQMSLAAIRDLATEVGMRPGAKAITPTMECASSDFSRGFHAPGVYHLIMRQNNETNWKLFPGQSYANFSYELELADNSDDFSGNVASGVVFRDAGFVSDSVKINVEQVFKLLSPATEIKTL